MQSWAVKQAVFPDGTRQSILFVETEADMLKVPSKYLYGTDRAYALDTGKCLKARDGDMTDLQP